MTLTIGAIGARQRGLVEPFLPHPTPRRVLSPRSVYRFHQRADGGLQAGGAKFFDPNATVLVYDKTPPADMWRDYPCEGCPSSSGGSG